MRCFIIGICALILATTAIVTGAAANEANQKTFPYSVHVLENGSYVRSGPGKAYYPTERLSVGDTVEVYRHDPGGWLAIRPTEKSFSWVRSRYLKPLGDGLAEVTGSRVASRMGSRLDDAKDVIQVRLHKGETVELVNPKALDHGTREPWIKIRPPSGEFRWIHNSLVDLQPTDTGIRRTRRNQTPITPRSTHEEVQPRRSAPPQPRTTSRTYDGQPMHFAHDQRPQPNATRTARNHTPAPVENEQDFEEKLATLELELSQMVASDPRIWSFDHIAMDAEALAGYSQTAVDRGRIRNLLSKIDRFEEVQAKKEQLDQMIAQHERANHRLAMRSAQLSQNRQPTTDTPTAVATLPTLDNRYDGTGVLRRVQPVSKGAPTYALVDGTTGQIRSYVTPAPGVSLNYYENRSIGVTGSRGYMPYQKKFHVMAKRIQLLR